MKKTDINEVKEAHEKKIMDIHGVTGIGIGLTDDKKKCIRIFINDSTLLENGRLPTILEGFPVEIKYSGEFKPFNSQ